MRNSLTFVMALILSALFCSSCTVWVSRTAIEAKAQKAASKLDVPLYFASAEVGSPFEVVGTVNWYKLSIFSSKAKIGRMARKKGAKLLRKGKLKQIDGILIQDRFNAHYIRRLDGTGALTPLKSHIQPPNEEEDVPKKFLGRDMDEASRFTAGAQMPGPFRLGGGLTVATYRGGYAGLQARGAYRISALPELEIGLDLGWWFSRTPRTLLTQLSGRYYLDARQLNWFPLDVRLYPMAGFNLSPYQAVGERRLSPGVQLGLGAEYRLNEQLMLFLEPQLVWRNNTRNTALINLGLMAWKG